MIELKNVTKEYDGVKILDNINISFPKKGFVSILGASGSGKSTLLNLIGKLDTPTYGNIFFNNINIKEIKDEIYHGNYVGFVFQNYNLLNNLNVQENIELKSKINYNYINKLNIKTLLNKKVNKLSGGEKQRIALIRALNSNNMVILADEPTGALDSINSKKVLDILKELSKNILVIMVTHNEKDAIIYSDYIIKTKDGKITNKINIKKEKIVIPNIKPYKNKISKIIYNNLKSKLKRNLLTIIAIAIGLISLLMVLSISDGFKNSIDKTEKEELSRYPIYISKTSDQIELYKKTTKNVDNKIIVFEENHINEIRSEYINYLNNYDELIEFKLFTYYENDLYYYKYNDNLENKIKLLTGKLPKENEIILIVDNNKSIDTNILKSIDLFDKEYEYDDLIGYQYKDFIISGIGIFNDEILNENYGLFINENKEIIPYEIYLYPKDYESKIMLKKHLDNYESIKYVDYSTSIKDISKTIINGIEVVLICFSLISLLVSTIMIGILTYINVLERMHEIGILKSLGFNNKKIKEIFSKENSILGIIAALISIIIVYILSIPLNNIIYNISSLSGVIKINLENIIIIIELSIFLTNIGSFIPLRKLNKINIIDALRYE